MTPTLPQLRRAGLGLAFLLAVGMPFAQAAGPPVLPVALVISDANYGAFPKLSGCEASANLVAAVLSRAGFKVLRQNDASNARLGTAISALGEDAAAAPGSRTLIYVCSYALLYADRLFLLPAESRVDRESDVLSQGIVARLLMSSVAGPGSAAGLVLMDVAPPPGRGALGFDSLLRPTDSPNAGLVAAALPAVDSQGPARLASALADAVAGGQIEVGALLASLATQPGLSRSLLFNRAPSEPSWLLGAPTPTEAAPTPPAPPLPATVAPATAMPADKLAELNPAERRRVQLSLSRLGYYRGRVTGVFGADTLAAIRQFQKDSNMEPTGKLTTRQVDQLLQ